MIALNLHSYYSTNDVTVITGDVIHIVGFWPSIHQLNVFLLCNERKSEMIIKFPFPCIVHSVHVSSDDALISEVARVSHITTRIAPASE